MLTAMEDIIILLLFVSVFGYIFAILDEKSFAKNNDVFLDNKNLTQDHLKEAAKTVFILRGDIIGTGDEIKIITGRKEKLKGTVIGFDTLNETIHIITFDNEIKKIKRSEVLRFRVKGRCGKFFNY